MTQKEFIFLYPIHQIFNFEINNYGWSRKGGINAFRKIYSNALNQCIDQRYRQNGFGINYVVFDDCIVSDIINLQPEDKTLKAGIDFKIHTTEKTYPVPDHILSQFGKATIIRVAGFHMWDCVEKLAKCAYEKEFDVLVDEDLTELFSTRFEREYFRSDKYPTYKPKKQGYIFKEFVEARKHRPWFWQNY
ncbi:MAG: hypothetical protein P1P85_03050 [Patescibacteria group bacterium]|nr:hypothetical protein [Patescibacteria group bacterium]